jgi:hypothetical protein
LDYYTVLGISPKASVDEIERAFRKVAREVHPDRNSGDANADARMQQLNQIRETLTDPLLRAAYDDQLRRETDTFRPPPPQPPPPRDFRQAGPSPSRWSGYEPHPHVAAFLRTEAERRAAEVQRPRRGPIVALLVIATLSLGAVILMWPRPEPVDPPIHFTPPPPPPPPRPVPRPAVTVVRGDTAATRRAIRRTSKVVPEGASLDEVIHQFGPPDRIESHPAPGDVTLLYGQVRVELRGGKVVGGTP